MTDDRQALTPVAPAATGRTFLGPGITETAIFGLSVLTGPLVSRALGDAGRGDFAAVVVPVQLLGWALWLGVPYAASMLVRDITRRRLIDSTWRIALFLLAPIAALGWLAAPALLHDHPDSAVTWFRIGMLTVVLGLPSAAAVQLRLISTGATWRTSLAQSLYLVIYTVAVVALAATDRLTLTTALASWVGGLAVSQLVLLAVYHGTPRGLGDTATVRRQLLTGRPHWVLVVSSISVGRLDQVFLSVLSTSATLGHYAVAATCAQLSLPVANGIANVVLPDAFARGDTGIHTRGVRLVIALSVGLTAITALTAPWVLPAVFGDDFDASVTLLFWMLPGQILYNTAWVLSAHHLGTGRAADAARSIATAAIVNAALLAPAITWFGAPGAAVLTSVCQGLYLVGVLARRRNHPSLASASPEAVSA